MIRERALGKDHADVASILNGLGVLLQARGAFAEARPLFERSLAINERTLGRDHVRVGANLNNLAVLLLELGDYAGARPLLERSLAISEKALGKEHPDIATALSNLATLLRDLGAFGEARSLFERALAIDERALGKDHPDVASSLRNLAELLRAQGAYAEARPLFERALAIWERALGENHPLVASCLLSLASLLADQGAYDEARPLDERALAVFEAALGGSHPVVATALTNLAGVLHAQGADSEARLLYERALIIVENSLGKDNPACAASLSNLGVLLRSQGAYADAKPFLERAVAVSEKAHGKDHPVVARALSNLAALLEDQGDHAAARLLLERVLSIYEGTFGPEHPEVAAGLFGLASLLEAQGAYGDARPRFELALAVTEAHARAQLSALGARQRLGLLRSTRLRLDRWLRFAPRVGSTGYAQALRLKGVVERSEAAERILARRARGDDRGTRDTLEAAARRAARLANEVPSSMKPEARASWQKAYSEACAEREKLTIERSKRSAPLRTALERLDLGLADIQAQLAPDVALVDLLRVGDRYLAWVVRAKGGPVRVDVGSVDRIDEACVGFVSAITDDAGVAEAGASLRALVWAPIEAKLGDGVARVVIVPDAALAAIPFAALPGKAPGRQLVDDLAISYVMNAQDLVPWNDAPPVGASALLVGGVDYEHADVGTKGQPPPERPIVVASLDRAPRGGGQFTPIPQTKVEVEGLRDRFGKDSTTLLLGTEATEARLRGAVKGKRFLHIATHGFAREDLLVGLYSRRIEEAWTSADAERQLGAGHDPMLLSGLAMAGANPREGAAGDDGILTALEASYLDLDGVDLATLSACETAKGTAESGEGVQGLVQAFQMAGARRVIASLWKVDDEGTRRLMDGVYERMLRRENSLSPADALREAAISLRDLKDASGKARFASPRFWAAFVAYGR